MKKKAKNVTINKKKEFRYHDIEITNRRGRKIAIGHPAYIFLQKGNVYVYVSITHSNRVNDYLLIKLKRNPNPKDDRDSYIVVDIKEDTKDQFGGLHKSWSLDPEDDELIRRLYDKIKKKR